MHLTNYNAPKFTKNLIETWEILQQNQNLIRTDDNVIRS